MSRWLYNVNAAMLRRQSNGSDFREIAWWGAQTKAEGSKANAKDAHGNPQRSAQTDLSTVPSEIPPITQPTDKEEMVLQEPLTTSPKRPSGEALIVADQDVELKDLSTQTNIHRVHPSLRNIFVQTEFKVSQFIGQGRTTKYTGLAWAVLSELDTTSFPYETLNRATTTSRKVSTRLQRKTAQPRDTGPLYSPRPWFRLS
jgi:hypothetical protein